MILRCCVFLLFIFTTSFSFATELNPLGSTSEGISAKKINVVATIRPIHSILSFIMRGSDQPTLLLDQPQSIHHYNLRPSQRRTLSNADILFWVGEPLESFMPRVISSLPKHVKSVELITTQGLTLLEPRSTEENHNHAHGHHDEHIDPHIWLSINNALIIATKIATTLTKQNPALKQLYLENLNMLSLKLLSIKNKLGKTFEQNSFNYLVYHDAFQYFENQINIKPLIAISTDEEQTPGIKHLRHVKNLASKNKISCLIYNTPTLPSVAKNILNEEIQKIYADPLGQNFKANEELYFNLLNSLSKNYQQCQQAFLKDKI